MSVEADIVNALQGLFPKRVYADFAPAGTAKPYCAYQQVGGVSPTFVENGLPSKKNGRFQVAVWGDTRTAVAALGLQIEQVMVFATTFQARPLGAAVAVFDDSTQLRGSRQDFDVWSDR